MTTFAARAVGIPARQVGTPCWNTGPFAGLARDNPNVTQCWAARNATAVGGPFLNNHQWVEYWDTTVNDWVYINMPPDTTVPNQGLCNWTKGHGCPCNTGPGAAMQDHPILAATWGFPSPTPSTLHGGEVIDARTMTLSNGEDVSPLVWSPRLKSALGVKLKDVGLRFVNRTDFYRCQ